MSYVVFFLYVHFSLLRLRFMLEISNVLMCFIKREEGTEIERDRLSEQHCCCYLHFLFIIFVMKKSRTAEQCIETRAHKSFNYGKCTLMNPTNTNAMWNISRKHSRSRGVRLFLFAFFRLILFIPFHFDFLSFLLLLLVWMLGGINANARVKSIS